MPWRRGSDITSPTWRCSTAALTHSSHANEDSERRHPPQRSRWSSWATRCWASWSPTCSTAATPTATRGPRPSCAPGSCPRRAWRSRAAEIGLPDLLRLGRGEEKTGGRGNAALWADAYEALVASLYLDGGIETAQSFVNAEFAPELAALQQAPDVDHKSALQEVLQARGEPVPEYEVLAEEALGHRTRFRGVAA